MVLTDGTQLADGSELCAAVDQRDQPCLNRMSVVGV